MDAGRNRQFQDLLLRMTGEDAPLAELEREIWDRFGFEGAVLVTDLSGFTQHTRSKGILHYLLLIHHAATLTIAEVGRHRGSPVKLDADNVIAVFPTAADAVECAAAVHAACDEHNTRGSEDGRIGMCIGVSSGRMLRLDGDLFGDPVNTAYKLGEDLARPGQTLVESRTASQVTFGPESTLRFSEERSEAVGGAALLHRELVRGTR